MKFSILSSLAFLGCMATLLAADPNLPPEKMLVKPGEAMTTRSLVLNPPALKGALSWTLESRTHRYFVGSSTLSPDGTMLVTGGYDGTVRFWDTTTGELKQIIAAHDSYVLGLAFSPGGKYLATGGSYDGTAKIWDMATLQKVRTLREHPGYVAYLAWSEDGSRLFGCGGNSGDISLWNTSTGKKLAKAAIGTAIRAISRHPDGNRIAVIAAKNPISLFDISAEKIVDIVGEAAADYLSLAYSPDGKTLAAGSATHLYQYYGDTGKMERKNAEPSNTIVWTVDGKSIGTGTPNVNRLKFVLPETGKEDKIVSWFADRVMFNKDGSKLFGSNHKIIAGHDMAANKIYFQKTIAGSDTPYWQPNRAAITGVGLENDLTLWDTLTGQRLRKLTGHTDTVTVMAWSHDGKRIATGSNDRSVRVWDPATGEQKQLLSLHASGVTVLSWSFDGKLLASGSSDHNVVIWDVAKAESVKVLSDCKKEITLVEWSPGASSHLIVGSRDPSTIIYATKNWEKLKSFQEASPSRSASWSSDGKNVHIGFESGMLKGWTIATAKQIYEVNRGGGPPVVCMASTASTLALGSSNHGAFFVSPTNGAGLASMSAMAPVVQVSFANMNTVLSVTSQDRSCRFFDVTSRKPRGSWILEGEQIVAVTMDGNIRVSGDTSNDYLAIVQTDKGQELLTLAQFTEKYKWKNDATKTKAIVK